MTPIPVLDAVDLKLDTGGHDAVVNARSRYEPCAGPPRMSTSNS
jgi:hypothetical protein